MRDDNSQPTLVERTATWVADRLQRAGLHRLVYSRPVRAVAKRLLLRSATTGPRIRAIVTGEGRGLKLQVLPGTPVGYWMGTHEPHMQAVLRDQIRPGMVVYDCGANVGYTSVILGRLVGPTGRVVAFEPSPASVSCLEAARLLNGFNHILIVPKAVWSRSETLRFACTVPDGALATDHVEGAFGESAQASSVVEVPAISLDEFVYSQGNPPPDFVKIDVEGSEGHAIAGAARLISEHRPRLLLEIHGEPGREVWPLLKRAGYTFTNIATGEVPNTVDEFAIWIRQYLAVPT